MTTDVQISRISAEILSAGVAVTHFSDDRPRCVPESFFHMKDGRIALLFDDQYGGVDDDSPARICVLFSGDDGATWGDERVVLGNDGKRCSVGPSVLRLQSGKVVMSYMRQNADDDLRGYLRYGDESLARWSEPVCITNEPGYHCSSGSRLIQLASGRLIYPTSWTASDTQDGSLRAGKFYVAYVWHSDDEGQSWKRNEHAIGVPRPANAERGAMEPVIAETPSGELFMLMRTQLGFLYQSRSSDGGLTWSATAASQLQSPEACPFVMRIPLTGDLLAIWNDSPYLSKHPQYGIRRPLSVAISRDEGRSWSRSVAIATEDAYTYAMPISTFTEEWAIFAYYRATGVQWAGHMQCEVNRCRIDELYALAGVTR